MNYARAFRICLVLGTSLVAPAALAQSVPPSTPVGTPSVVDPAPADGKLAEIIVTAQRTANNVQRVPIAIQAVTGDTLLKAGIQDVRDLQRFVPGLYAAPTGAGGSSFYIRGVGSINEAPSADSGLAVSLDQVFILARLWPRSGALRSRAGGNSQGPAGNVVRPQRDGGIGQHYLAQAAARRRQR